MKFPKQGYFYVPFTEGVNAFNFHWSNEINYLVPPVFLIPKIIKHIEKCTFKGILVVPYWPSAVSWPLLASRPKIYTNRSLRIQKLFIAVKKLSHKAITKNASSALASSVSQF